MWIGEFLHFVWFVLFYSFSIFTIYIFANVFSNLIVKN